MTDADKVMNPQHFVTNPADIRVEIRINAEIQLWILDHFTLDPVFGEAQPRNWLTFVWKFVWKIFIWVCVYSGCVLIML